VHHDIRVPTPDGAELVGDLIEVDGAWAGAVVCHPHPDFGGDRHNLVVDRVFHALAAAGVTALRFDFRPGGEATDVVAALDRVAVCVDEARPLWLVGYSYGADIALSVDDPRVAGWAAVAPPFRFGAGPVVAPGGDPRPVLLVAAAHDQFHPPDRLRAATAGWPAATVVEVPGADPFLAGATQRVADAVVGWLDERRQAGSDTR
jgi:uncharacterized protein